MPIETIPSVFPQMGPGPYAIRKVVRGPDGSMRTIMVDAQTNQPIGNTDGYTVLSGGNYSPPEAPAQEQDTPGSRDNPTTSQQILDPRHEGGNDSPAIAATQGSRNPVDNYGYLDKPGLMNYANFIPGPVGTVARVANTAINTNNEFARRDARESLGLDNSFGGLMKGALKDNKGQVADITIGDNDYSVGFEAMSPQGRTNLTPNEARVRAAIQNVPVQETAVRPNVDGKKGLLSSFVDKVIDTPTSSVASETAREQDRGILSTVADRISNFVDSVFGGDEPTAAPVDRNYFPGAPTAPSNDSDPSPGNQTRNISNAVGGVSSIDNSPDDRDSPGRSSSWGGGGVTSGGTGLW